MMQVFEHVNKVIAEDIRTVIAADNIDWYKLSGKTVLITGANGFLPAYMVLTLLALNDELNLGIRILALVRNREKAKVRFKDLLTRNDIELIVQDVSKPIAIEEDIHFIIHAASQASPKFYGSDPVGTINANVLGTSYLLELAAQKKVEKFLFFSSSEIYGLVDENKIPITEKDYGYIDSTNVRSCYSEGKKLGETLCVSWMHQYQVAVSIIRIFHTYGPGMDLYDGRVFADFIADIVYNRDIVMKSDGVAIRAFCYLTDAITGYFLVMLNGVNGEAYNVGNTKGEISVIDLADKLITLFPEKNLKVIRKEQSVAGYIQSSVQRVVPNTDKLQALGWKAKVDVATGFKRTITSCVIESELTQ